MIAGEHKLEEMREALIKQAVTFLTNPGLSSTPLDKKQTFLQDKGLSGEEIEEAFRRSEEKTTPATSGTAAASAPRRSVINAPGSPVVPSSISSSIFSAATSVPTTTANATPTMPMQAVLLLKRRLAELEHERACYIEALGALGGAHSLDANAVMTLPASTGVIGLTSPVAAAATAISPAVVPQMAPAIPSVSTGGVGVGTAGMRETQIKQAVNFLANPSLVGTPWEERRAFLKGKGLSDVEIDDARRRVEGNGTASNDSSASPASATTQFVKKPWETVAPKASTESNSSTNTSEEVAGALPATNEGLRDDDPDLVEILQPRKQQTDS